MFRLSSLGGVLVLCAVLCGCQRVALEERVTPRDVARQSEPLLIDAEQDVDPPVVGNAPGAQSASASASNGTISLVVWNDSRGAPYAARVSSAGALLDVQGIRLPAGLSVTGVASNGTDFMVVASGVVSTVGTIGTVRVSATGALLDPAWVTVATFVVDSPRIASDGTQYLVVWGGGGLTSDATARFVSSANVPTGPEFSLVRGTPAEVAAQQIRVSVSFGGGAYLVTWVDLRSGGQYALWGALVSPAGVVAGDVNFAIRPTGTVSANASPSAFNAGANEFLVVWVGNSNIEGQRVTLAGALAGLRLTLSPTGGTLTAATVASNGTDWYATWANENAGGPDVAGVRVTGAGAVMSNDAITSLLSGETLPHVAALAGGNYLATWTDTRSGTSDIFGNRLSGLGAKLDPSDLLISRGNNLQDTPQVAFDGTNWLVVWADQRAGQSDILGVRYDQNGARLDASPISIATTTNVEVEPDVAFDGSSYLVVWEDRGAPCFFPPCNPPVDVLGRRVTTAGATPGAVFVISNASSSQQRPRVAGAGGTSLVVWTEARQAGTSSLDIFGARVSGGTVLDPTGIAINASAGLQETPDVAWMGGQFFVAWSDQRSGGTSTYKIYGTRVQTDGTVNAPAGTLITDVAMRVPFAPAVTSNGLEAFVGWTSVVGGNALYGRRISPTGAVLGSADSVLMSGSRELAMTYDAPNYLVAFRDQRIDPGDIGAGRWTTTLGALDPLGFTVSANADPNSFPAAAAGTLGRVLIAYATVDSTLFAPRVKVRRLSRSANGATCSDASDCQSGFCADGVCCNTACGGGVTTDCQACSVASGATTDGTCAPRVVGTVCRAANGVCDAAETCNGTATTCPADGFAPATTVCRAATTTCDAEERCTGSANACPADAFAPATTVCRAPAGVCDAEERCTGANTTCPADLKLGNTTVCRAANGTCDVAERCGTAGDACPVDGVRPSGFTCRASMGVCDVVEVCTGTAPACPADGFAAPTVTCRVANGECDVAESCSGTAAACPSNQLQPDGTMCSLGVCGAGVCFDPDAGVPDAGVDAGLPDAGLPDAGVPDAGGSDAGGSDAGVPDAGDNDAGLADAGEVDAGEPDAGEVDAGALDGGSSDAGGVDSGAPDSGTSQPPVDAGQMMTADAGTDPTMPTGCGCSEVDASALIVALGLLLRRRAQSRGFEKR